MAHKKGMSITLYFISSKHVFKIIFKNVLCYKDNALSIAFICSLCFCGIYFSNDCDEISSNTHTLVNTL